MSFFAFTATPKPKTLEMFGTPRTDGRFQPFSLYSMRQAIEEKFILDVLKNYTTFQVYFGLNKRIHDDPQYSKKKAMSLLKSYVDLHEHNLRSKTEIILEHFNDQVRDRIRGRAKAMIVTRSRLHAVRYKQMFDLILKEHNLPYKALVAFSGKVKDYHTGKEYTESEMNGFPESQTVATFRKPQYRFLIVAEKFQTGFDQPLLHTMYVDKKLSGVNTVQTLSRLNRIHPDKSNTMVLDFVNKAEHIQAAFQPYYETTLLTEATDPNKLYDLKRKIEDFHVYTREDVDEFTRVYFTKTGTQQKLRVILDAVVPRFKELEKEQREACRKAITDYTRLYAFLSHILRFQDVELEKAYQFLRHLRPLLKEAERLPKEILDQVNMDLYRVTETSTGTISLIAEDGEIKPVSETKPIGAINQEIPLSEIIDYINKNFGTDFTDEDKVKHFADDMQRRLVSREGLRASLDPEINPSREQQRLAFNNHFDDILDQMIEANEKIYKKIVDDEQFGNVFKRVMFEKILRALFKESA